MIIKSIDLFNFMHFKESKVDIGEGVFFISGENRDESSSDSNGSGKSVFCQSIAWCLFDDILRKGVLKNDVIGSYGKWARVSVSVEKDGKDILITRYRGHPDFGNDVKVYIDGSEDKSKHKSEDSNKFIEDLLGVSTKILYYCAYSDDDKEPFVALSPANISKVVSEILDSSRFDKYVKDIRSMIKDKDRDKLHENSLLESEAGHVTVCEQDIANLEAQIDDFDDDKLVKIKDIKDKITEIKGYIESYSGMTDDKPALTKMFADLKPAVEEVGVIRSSIVSKNRSKSNVEADLLSAEKKVYKFQGELASVEESYNNIFNNFSGECHYCGNPLAASKKLDGKSDTVSKKRDKITAELALAEIDRDDRLKVLAAIKADIAELSEKEESLREVVLKYEDVKSKLASIKEVETTLEFLHEKAANQRALLKEVEISKPTALVKLKNEKVNYLKELEANRAERFRIIISIGNDIDSLKFLLTAVMNTKSSVFNYFIMSLQDKINENLQKISEGDYVCALKTKGEDCVLTFAKGSDAEGGCSYHVFSKGERTRISKAVSVALNDMMNVGFYIDDEGLPGLDRSGVRSVLDFVLSITGAKTLFFVSHDEAVRDYFKGSPNLHIIKENGKATVELR